jgi:hypothetical protein
MIDLLALKQTCFFLTSVAAIAMATGASAAEVEIQKTEHGVTITIHRAPFAEYLIKSEKMDSITATIFLIPSCSSTGFSRVLSKPGSTR